MPWMYVNINYTNIACYIFILSYIYVLGHIWSYSYEFFLFVPYKATSEDIQDSFRAQIWPGNKWNTLYLEQSYFET